MMMWRASLFIAFVLISARVLATPDIQHWQTAKGVHVYFVELPELPIVDVQVLFDAGSARDPKGKNGIALLTNSLLDEGAGGLDANAISFEFEKLGAQYGSDTGYDSASVSLRSLSDEHLLEPALANLQRVIASPDFPEAALERQRNRLLISIQQKNQSPSAIAADAFLAAIYSPHPYAEPKEGTAETVKNITRRDVVEFYEQLYTAQNAAVAIVGAISRERAQELAEALIGALPPGERQEPILPVSNPAVGQEIKKIFPSAQTHVIAGQPGIKRGDPDFFALYVGNHILGGNGLISRLSEEIRQQRGLSYAVYSYFSLRRERGPFVAGLQTRADQAPEALRVLRDTIGKYIADGPDKKEVEAAKRNITGGFPLQIDSNSQILGYVAVIGFYGLPLDYLDTFIDKIEAVTVADIKSAFQRHLDVNRFITVLVGPEAAAPPGDAD